jgi:hypothetical protein
MADQLQRARIIAIDEIDFGISRNRLRQVNHRAIQRHGHCAFG